MAVAKEPAKPSGNQAPVARTATPDSIHKALVALGIMTVFVYVLYVFAGLGPNEGKVAVTLLAMVALVQLMNSTPEAMAWWTAHPTRPTKG